MSYMNFLPNEKSLDSQKQDPSNEEERDNCHLSHF